MKNTLFTHLHVEKGAKMAPFAGYNMPISYSGTIEEHLNVVKNVGLFDVSHMGALIVTGTDAYTFLQNLCSNDISKLSEGKAQYNYLPNDRGGIVDDFILYHLGDKYMMAVNAANIEKDYEWVKKHVKGDVQVSNESERVSILALQGPKAKDTLQPLVNVNLEEIPFYEFRQGKFMGMDAIISNTGYTGAGGFELYFFDLKDPETVWNGLLESGEKYGILPTGLGARDTLRLEMGYCLYGNDIDDTTSPLEAGLGWITKLTEEKQTPSKELFVQQKNTGIQRRLIAFEIEGKGIARHGNKVFDADGNEIGYVTSGTISPCMNKGIGLAYVKIGFEKPGTSLFVNNGRKDLSATVVKLPFRK